MKTIEAPPTDESYQHAVGGQQSLQAAEVGAAPHMERHRVTGIGLLCGVTAAVLYTAANICLRRAVHIDPVWVSALKAVPTFVLIAPIVFVRMANSQPVWTTKRDFLWLVATGLCAQIFGNVAFQWSLGILGLAISVPMILGAMLVGGAIVGKLVLGEPVKPRTAVGVAVLIVAVFALTLGARGVSSAGALLPDDVTWWQIVLATLGNLSAGAAYAFLGTMMRRSMQAGMPMSTTLFILSSVGTTLLVTWSIAKIGWVGISATNFDDLVIMISAGTFNALAFFLLAKALQQIPVLYVQMLNATQAAMAAAAGWLLFGEILSLPVQIGLLLTAAGLIIAGTRPRRISKASS